MQGYIIALLRQLHGVMCVIHEFVGEAESAVGAEDGEGGDVGHLRLPIGLIVHLGEDVSDDLSILLGDVEEFGPGEVVVEIVVEVVVLRQAPQVAVLHLVQVADLRATDRWHLQLYPPWGGQYVYSGQYLYGGRGGGGGKNGSGVVVELLDQLLPLGAVANGHQGTFVDVCLDGLHVGSLLLHFLQ
jgi:hypothetical protein